MRPKSTMLSIDVPSPASPPPVMASNSSSAAVARRLLHLQLTSGVTLRSPAARQPRDCMVCRMIVFSAFDFPLRCCVPYAATRRMGGEAAAWRRCLKSTMMVMDTGSSSGFPHGVVSLLSHASSTPPVAPVDPSNRCLVVDPPG